MRRALLVLGALLLGAVAAAQPAAPPPAAAPAAPPAAAPASDEPALVALYLPGLYFSQVRGKAELGDELARHLSAALGRPATSRIYATAEAMDADRAHITVALLEAPTIAARLTQLTPLCVAAEPGEAAAERPATTRLVVLAPPPLRDVRALPGRRLAYAAQPGFEAFLEHVVFEGELHLGEAALSPARDAASALSKISLRKAEAVLLYEEDAERAAPAGLRPLYQGPPLPRPSLVVFDDNQAAAQVGRLREAMCRFSGQSHPRLRAFRPTTPDPYLALHWQMQRRAARLPPLLDLGAVGSGALALPGLSQLQEAARRPQPPLPQPPLRLYAPTLP